MARRRSPVADRLTSKLNTLRQLSRRDHRAIERLIDDVLKRRMAKIEETEIWNRKIPRLARGD